MTDVTWLGPQTPDPNLRRALDALGVDGPLCAITAGWQEREGELEELRPHVDREVVDLAIYHRAEHVAARDPELSRAHRERQQRLKQLQQLYRLRLQHAREAARELMQARGEKALIAPERRAALGALRNLDRHHLQRIRKIHAEFQLRWRCAERPAVAGHREDLRQLIAGCATVLIAGGHVGALLSRCRLFELRDWLAAKPLIAWSAGAMMLAERIVLFHDTPPQGFGVPEVFDGGLGLVRAHVPLPNARSRLRLAEEMRVALFAQRFLPARCLVLEPGSLLRWRDGRLVECAGASRLTRAGQLQALSA